MQRFTKERTFDDILHIVIKDFAFILIPIMISTPIGFIIVKGIKPMYKSSATAYIRWQADYWKQNLLEGVVRDDQRRQREFAIDDLEITLRRANEMLLDPRMLDETIRKMQYIRPGPDAKRIAGAFRQAITPKVAKETSGRKSKEETTTVGIFKSEIFERDKEKDKRFVSVVFKHPNPGISKNGANLALEVVKAYVTEIEREKGSKRLGYLQQQTAYYRKKYDVARSVLEKYRQSSKREFSEEKQSRIKELLGFDPGTRIDEIRYDKFKGDLVDLNLELKGLMEMKGDLEEEIAEVEEYIVDEEKTEEDAELQVLKKNLSDKKLLLAKLSIDSSPNHPLVRQIGQEIVSIEALVDKVSEIVDQRKSRIVNPAYEKLREKISNVKTQINTAKTKIELTTLTIDDMKEKLEVQREIRDKVEKFQEEVNEAKKLMNNFEDKLKTEELRVNLEGEDPNFLFNIEEASRPQNLLLTTRVSIFSRQIGLGLLCAFAILYLRNARDTSYRTALELRKDLKIPVFGSTTLMVAMAEASREKKFWQLTAIGYVTYLALIAGYTVYF